ncbi:hypothetical protein L596_027888 [Steinernema carpocapsae]|uniref:Uncharacterized protein n=1 Tax=Steinernema carpocapsae TaxID=34508 RepID=A0A4U5LWU1_STECR|nr:hypothetical protein L596_027888 [Steinernema carpocapsae]
MHFAWIRVALFPILMYALIFQFLFRIAASGRRVASRGLRPQVGNHGRALRHQRLRNRRISRKAPGGQRSRFKRCVLDREQETAFVRYLNGDHSLHNGPQRDPLRNEDRRKRRSSARSAKSITSHLTRSSRFFLSRTETI